MPNADFERRLTEGLPKLSGFRAVLGFDGFEDRVVRLGGIATMSGLGRYLLDRQEMSGLLSYHEREHKMGGNMPIMANALGRLGIACDCVGTFGEPEAADVFARMSPNCVLYTVGQPGQCFSLEFDSGKLMLSDSAPVETLRFEDVVARIGSERLVEMHERADLICYLNWSEMPGLTGIERYCLRYVVPRLSEKPRAMLLDLSDVTPRKSSELREELSLLGAFSERMRTVLSLNENEARAVLKLLTGEDPGTFEELMDDEARDFCKCILEGVGVRVVVLRGNRRVFAAENGAFHALDTMYVARPALLTGAGDNFNAGIAAALLIGADLEETLLMGTLTCSHYIELGVSPSQESVLKYYGNRKDG